MGGIAYTPYLPAQAGSSQESTSSSGSTSSSKPEKITGTIKGEIAKLLSENGLPSDVSVLLHKADNFLNNSRSLSQKSLFGGTDDDYDLSDLIKVQQLVNDVKYNNNLRNKAVEQLTKQFAGSEVAITDAGRIYAYNKDSNEIEKLTPSEYNEKRDKCQALTNNELLNLREQSPSFAFKTDMLNDLQNAIGMNAITKYLRDTIAAFGSDKIGGYTTKDDSIKRGMDILTNAGPDGYYQFTKEEELRDVNRALRYLYNGMPENAKNLLKAKTAVEGGNPSDPNDISNLLYQALLEHTSRETTVKFDKPATEYDPKQSGKKGGSNAGEQLTKDTYAERLTTGNGLDPERWIDIMPSNTGVTLHAYSQNAAGVLKDQKRLNTTNLQVVLSEADAIGAIVDPQSVTFGNQLLNPKDFKAVMYDSTTNMKRVWLPVRTAPDGRITPDFDAQQKLEQVQQYLANNNGQVADAWINNWLQENLPQATWNAQTRQVTFNKEYMRPFLVLHGIAASNRVSIDTDTPYLHHLSADEGVMWKDEYKRVVTEESINGKLEHNKAKGANRYKYYSGNIYLPISGPVVGSMVFNDQYFTKDTYTDITNKARASEVRQQMKLNF